VLFIYCNDLPELINVYSGLKVGDRSLPALNGYVISSLLSLPKLGLCARKLLPTYSRCLNDCLRKPFKSYLGGQLRECPEGKRVLGN
jgi:hypothetical protein